MFKRLVFCALLSLATMLLVTIPVSDVEAQVGPPGGTIYAHDRMYETVATPTNLPDHGKFDTLYFLGDDYAPVSDAAPGDRHYNGGRWEVRQVKFTGIFPMQFTNAEDVLAAADNGDIEIGNVVARFVCPLKKK